MQRQYLVHYYTVTDVLIMLGGIFSFYNVIAYFLFPFAALYFLTRFVQILKAFYEAEYRKEMINLAIDVHNQKRNQPEFRKLNCPSKSVQVFLQLRKAYPGYFAKYRIADLEAFIEQLMVMCWQDYQRRKELCVQVEKDKVLQGEEIDKTSTFY